MYFIGINPEDTLPDKSLLSKFRTQRLEESTLDEIITEIVRQCVEKGIIKGTGVSIDATHIEANTIKKTPERLMKHLARKIIKTYEKENNKILENLPEVPNYKEIEDHKEAKAVMKSYLETVIDIVEKNISQNTGENNEIETVIKRAQEIIEDPKFINQKGVRSIIDEDARVGHKSKTQNFFGYKTEFVMTTDERIVTSVKTADGAYVDGTYANEMINQTLKAGVKFDEFYADKAYFRKPILNSIKEIEAKAYIPVSESVYRIDESKFSYNKDSDEWQCSQGNITVKKRYYKTKGKNRADREGYKYYFELKQCKDCPKHNECAKTSARKILQVGLNTAEFYEISQYQKTEEYLEKYKKRASIEGKNAELKRFHGLYRARGYGLLSVSLQSKLAVIAVNIKRIAAIATSIICIFTLKIRILN
jgi:IS5 family transposase